MKAKPQPRTVRAAIRASVPDGKLKRAKIILKADTSQESIGGFTEYERANGGDVVKLGAPASDDSFGITVRGHETRHATRHKPRRRKPKTANESIAGQIVDDVNIETSPLPEISGLRAYRRAHLRTAVGGVRTMLKVKRAIAKGTLKESADTRNGNILNAVRTLAMLHHYGSGGHEEIKTRDIGYDKVRRVIGDNAFRGVAAVVRMAKKASQRARAVSLLVALLETPEPEENEERTPEGESDVLMPPEEGDAFDGKMDIHDLRPKSVPCDKEKQITRRHAPNGVIINPTRYVNAVVSGDGNGLFARRVREKAGGCVLIDASGSMGANRENLSALCAEVPTATVGYYSGGGRSGEGTLCVYADKGKRYAGELNRIYGGNNVDLPAIRWMMRQPKPWTLVSDLEFCGGVLGSEVIAHALVERETRRGNLTVYRSLEAAYEAVGGKKQLGDATRRKARKARSAMQAAAQKKRLANAIKHEVENI
jgi:hypothetical protein